MDRDLIAGICCASLLILFLSLSFQDFWCLFVHPKLIFPEFENDNLNCTEESRLQTVEILKKIFDINNDAKIVSGECEIACVFYSGYLSQSQCKRFFQLCDKNQDFVITFGEIDQCPFSCHTINHVNSMIL